MTAHALVMVMSCMSCLRRLHVPLPARGCAGATAHTAADARGARRYVSEYAGVTRSAFVASQLDWRKLQENHTAMWLECARDTFRALDSNGDGVLSSADLVRTLRDKLRDDDVDLAVEEAMVTSCAESCGMTFDHFVRVLRSDSCDLGARLYDSRYYGRPQRVEDA